MRSISLITLVAGLSCMFPAHASDQAVRIGLGLQMFCGADFEASIRLPQRPYEFGFSYKSCTSEHPDPFTGRPLSETVDSSIGPFVNYLFTPEEKSTFYIGIALFTWSKTETYLVVNAPPGPPGSDSTTDLYFGGGYTFDWSKFGYTNIGLYFSPTAQLNVQTVGSSSSASGGNGLQARIGLRF